MTMERRVRRSSCRGIALELQLEASVRRGGLEYMVLATEEGLLVAGSNQDLDRCEDAAARLAGAPTTARSFVVRGERFLLGAAGGARGAVEAELTRAESGVARILAA